ncbi:hypothetical protein V6N12_063445 [Hibiscus sabdariffa]|uniref:Uncharacterized protein n=1 Tax=Hibiscus sabdariffa TaxID=183260 RepID=A0ABR2FBT2_9ROSI
MVDKNVDKQKGIVIRVENLLRTNCNREMRQTWNKEATIHICDENTIHSYFSGKKAPYTGVNFRFCHTSFDQWCKFGYCSAATSNASASEVSPVWESCCFSK